MIKYWLIKWLTNVLEIWQCISQEADNVEDLEFDNEEAQCENLDEDECADNEDNVSSSTSLQN